MKKDGVQVEWIGGTSYEINGKSGICKKALVSTWRGGQCVAVKLVKVAAGVSLSVGDVGGGMLFNEFGKLAGFSNNNG